MKYTILIIIYYIHVQNFFTPLDLLLLLLWDGLIKSFPSIPHDQLLNKLLYFFQSNLKIVQIVRE
jgi:hypothetical protein